MKKFECRNKSGAQRAAKFFFILHSAFLISLCRADDFGDISVEANAIYTGNTFHGYAEMRVNLENRSSSKSHLVTLIFPNDPSSSGNSISRLSRSVTLAPETRESVSLLQPPLPAYGDGAIRVEVDNHHEGEIRAPNPNGHCNYYSRGGQAATIFISRSLDFDAVEKLFHANSGAFTASKAVGPPDAKSSGYQPNSWMPDVRFGARTNWLELDYATPQLVDKIVIYNPQSPTSTGFIELIGTAGTNFEKIPMSSGANSSIASGWTTEFLFSSPTNPVKTVRLNFERTPPYNLAIDAVQISGPTGSQWASAARASSDNSASAGSYLPGRVNADSVESLRSELPISEWSENWLAYSPFDAVVINSADLDSMSSAVFSALTDYLMAGGNLIVTGRKDLPSAWHFSQKNNLRDGAEYKIGFGSCYLFNLENFETLDSKSAQTLRETVRNASLYWQNLPEDAGAANATLPIVANLKIPTRGIVVVMLAFIIVIGPVNIIYLNRRKHRTWMLWTIPAISLVTTLLVFVYSLLREGITPDTRIAGLTVLDQTTHRAATIGGTAFYCPLTPSSGLNFDFETEATPLIHVGYDRSGASREVDWSQSQHFSRGWVSARVPAYFHLRKPETRRERIQLINENGKMKIVNGLGAPIKSLWLADSKNNFYEATSIAAGQIGGLISTPTAPAAEKTGAESLLQELNFGANADSLTNNAEKFLLPNSYIAVLDGNPFIENALASSSPKRTKSSAIVFGIFDSTDTQ